MAEWNCPHELVTPAGTITFNAPSGDTYIHYPSLCDGLDGVPIRSSSDPAPLTDGANLHTWFRGARPITLGGVLRVRSVSADDEIAEVRTDLEEALGAALESIVNTFGAYRWTPTGKSQRSAAVRHDSAFRVSGAWQKTYVFGLLAPSPAVTS